MYCEISVEVFVHPITARIEKNINFDNSGMFFFLYFKSLYSKDCKAGTIWKTYGFVFDASPI